MLRLQRVSQDLLAQVTQSTRNRYFVKVNAFQVDLARLIKDPLRIQMLCRWLVQRIERTIVTDISLLDPHLLLVARLSILLIKLVQKALFNVHLFFLFLILCFFKMDLEIDLRA